MARCGQFAIDSSVKHSYDLRVVHGVLVTKYLGCRGFNFFGNTWQYLSLKCSRV